MGSRSKRSNFFLFFFSIVNYHRRPCKSTLNKQWKLISFSLTRHRCCKGDILFFFINGSMNDWGNQSANGRIVRRTYSIDIYSEVDTMEILIEIQLTDGNMPGFDLWVLAYFIISAYLSEIFYKNDRSRTPTTK